MHINETAFGQLAHKLSGGKFFAHQELSEQLPAGWLQGKSVHLDPEAVVDWKPWAARCVNSPATDPLSNSTPNTLSGVNPDTLVSWYGDNDSANPQNWSSAEKAFVAGLICLYTFTVYLGSALYTPSTIGVMQQFGVSYAAASLGLALFVFGYGSGAMFFSPLSEIPVLGRNWIYIITLFMYLAFSIGAAVAPSYGSLIIFRFLAGFVGSPALATGGATLQDMYSIVKLPYGIALWAAAASMGPALGPVMGGFAVEAKTWRWPLWIQVWFIAPVLVVMILMLPETSHANILLRRAQRLRKITGCTTLRSEAEIEQAKLSTRKIFVEALIRPIQISILDPGTGFMNLYVSLVYGIYYSFFESFPLVYPVSYGFGLGTTGLTFVCVVLTTVMGAAGYMYYIYYYIEPKIRQAGKLPILESRLIPAIPASIIMPIGLLIFGWASRESVHWIVGLIGSGIYSIGFYVFLQCVILYVPLVYPKYAASLLAANDFCRSTLAAGFVMSGHPLFKNLGVGPGVSLLAGLTVLCVPALLLLYKHGELLRSKSKFIEKERASSSSSTVALEESKGPVA
ncbi:uncharacterized protein UDID_06429 [Ustilago sp. UG-2017a]|nr:uncharacterized protein UDID_06429 [Ustilago sp. UG-2017a]